MGEVVTITITITAVRAPDCGDVSTAELRGRLPPHRRSGRARALCAKVAVLKVSPGRGTVRQQPVAGQGADNESCY